ncbi:PREDICTED: OTU domain-containing protein 5-B-like isoform X2 [Tarenaya hassleriana]|uniref:OTU domain-containing protein 5-B-like isoform X2 n=1 Tax=Tarenaya hassleriana TaxID=28532 RepID=UPI00053C1DFA|nr:PREDICTED: OTU domain-containing protein 5-B-like isoform X2 [Tarenaya hassleriana]
MGQELDPDVVRWDLQDLKVCTVANAGCCSSVTRYETDTVTYSRVREGYNGALTGYVQNDEVISHLYQEELSRFAHADALGFDNSSRSSVVSQEWFRPEGQENQGEANDSPEESGNHKDYGDVDDMNGAGVGSQEGESSLTRDMLLMDDDDDDDDSCSLDSVVGKRLNQMVSVPLVPKINGEIPTEDEQTSDHERLLQRLKLYGLVENKVQGDGNCQFHSLSDQLYHSPDHHKSVREQVVHQLAYNREIYEGYVPMAYNDYLKKMRRNGEWGDHVTLQATADWFGVRIFVITSFKDTCYIEILPHIQKSNRLICLSFWAEVHYNSIYPEGELPLPLPQSKKKKKFLVF